MTHYKNSCLSSPQNQLAALRLCAFDILLLNHETHRSTAKQFGYERVEKYLCTLNRTLKNPRIY